MRLIDISGQSFNGIIVIRRDGRDSTGKTTWKCTCHCGREFYATGLNLKSGNTKSCGCLKSQPRYIDRSGERHSRLTVLRAVKDARGRHTLWECLCDCGRETTVSNSHLFNGHTTSCGCAMIEASKEAVKSLHKKREEHPRWKGGLNPPRSTSWSRAIKKADGFCVKCGSNKKLQAHHITPVAECWDRAQDLSNGVTLCRDCHSEFHSIYGYSGATRADLFEYLGCDDPGDFSPWHVCDHELSHIIGLLVDGGLEALELARWYLDRAIAGLEAQPQPTPGVYANRITIEAQDMPVTVEKDA